MVTPDGRGVDGVVEVVVRGVVEEVEMVGVVLRVVAMVALIQ